MRRKRLIMEDFITKISILKDALGALREKYKSFFTTNNLIRVFILLVISYNIESIKLVCCFIEFHIVKDCKKQSMKSNKGIDFIIHNQIDSIIIHQLMIEIIYRTMHIHSRFTHMNSLASHIDHQHQFQHMHQQMIRSITHQINQNTRPRADGPGEVGVGEGIGASDDEEERVGV